MASAYRVDTHHHFFPPAYLSAIGGTGVVGALTGAVAGPPWSVEADLEEMAAHDISMAVLSISLPGLAVETEASAVHLARVCNEYAADLTRKYPHSFRFFASLPVLYDEPTRIEIDHSFDVLRASGVVLFTNYDGRYLGDELFVPMLEHLNSRDAVVFVHPDLPVAAPRFHPDIIPAVLEYFHDTARTIASLIFARRHLQFPRIRFIFSHFGGAVGLSIPRMSHVASMLPKKPGEPELDVQAALSGFYYDTAFPPLDADLYAFLNKKLFSPQHLLFGTDYPFSRSMGRTAEPLGALAIPEAERLMIERENAVQLLGL